MGVEIWAAKAFYIGARAQRVILQTQSRLNLPDPFSLAECGVARLTGHVHCIQNSGFFDRADSCSGADSTVHSRALLSIM